MSTMFCRTLVSAAALLILGTAAVASESKDGGGEASVKPAEVPAAVMDTLHVHFPKAHFIGFSREQENGATLFEAAMKIEGRHVDALLDSAGTVMEIETEIKVAELPAVVRAALGKSVYADGKIEGAERHVVPGSGEGPSYELHLQLRDKDYELVFDEKGRLAQGREEPDEKD